MQPDTVTPSSPSARGASLQRLVLYYTPRRLRTNPRRPGWRGLRPHRADHRRHRPRRPAGAPKRSPTDDGGQGARAPPRAPTATRRPRCCPRPGSRSLVDLVADVLTLVLEVLDLFVGHAAVAVFVVAARGDEQEGARSQAGAEELGGGSHGTTGNRHSEVKTASDRGAEGIPPRGYSAGMSVAQKLLAFLAGLVVAFVVGFASAAPSIPSSMNPPTPSGRPRPPGPRGRGDREPRLVDLDLEITGMTCAPCAPDREAAEPDRRRHGHGQLATETAHAEVDVPTSRHRAGGRRRGHRLRGRRPAPERGRHRARSGHDEHDQVGPRRPAPAAHRRRR